MPHRIIIAGSRYPARPCGPTCRTTPSGAFSVNRISPPPALISSPPQNGRVRRQCRNAVLARCHREPAGCAAASCGACDGSSAAVSPAAPGGPESAPCHQAPSAGAAPCSPRDSPRCPPPGSLPAASSGADAWGAGTPAGSNPAGVSPEAGGVTSAAVALEAHAQARQAEGSCRGGVVVLPQVVDVDRLGLLAEVAQQLGRSGDAGHVVERRRVVA